VAQVADAPGVTGAGGGLGAGIGGAAGVAVPSAVAAPIEALPAGAGPVARGGAMAIPAVTARRGRLARIAIHTVLLLGCLLMAFPFYWMVTTSFKTNVEALASPPTLWPQEWHPENYPAAMAAAPFGRYFFNTIFVAFWTVLGVLVVSTLAAYAFARMRFVGKNVLFAAFLATLMIPNEVTLIPNFVIITRWLGWYDTYQAQIVPVVGSVFAIFLLRQFFLTIPQDLEDAAKIDGCSQLRFLWSVIIPLSGPALITLALLNFLYAWDAFFWPLIVTRSGDMRPIQLGLQVFSSEFGSRYGEQMAATTVVMLPTVIAFLLAQRYFVEGITRTGLKG
jgi:multiple sugar transport system permease protein